MTQISLPRFRCDGPGCDVEVQALSRRTLGKVGWAITDHDGKMVEFHSPVCAARYWRVTAGVQAEWADILSQLDK